MDISEIIANLIGGAKIRENQLKNLRESFKVLAERRVKIIEDPEN